MKFERDTRYYDIALEQVGAVWEASKKWGSKVRNYHMEERVLFFSLEEAEKLFKHWEKRRLQHKYVKVEA